MHAYSTILCISLFACHQMFLPVTIITATGWLEGSFHEAYLKFHDDNECMCARTYLMFHMVNSLLLHAWMTLRTISKRLVPFHLVIKR